MTWLVELLVEGFWRGAVEGAHDRWGWLAALAVLLAPFAIVGALLWALAG